MHDNTGPNPLRPHPTPAVACSVRYSSFFL